MAVLNIIGCDNRKGSVNFNGNLVSIGQVWSATDIRGIKYCVTITDPTDEPSALISLQQQYADCYECLSANTAFLNFEVCSPFNNIIREIIIPITEFGSLPNIGDVFYVTLLYPIKEGQKIQTTLCMKFNFNIIPINQEQIIQLNSASSEILIPQTIQTSCEDCFLNNSQSYQVIRCTDQETIDCVLLPPNLYTNHLISYSDGTDIWCGIVTQEICLSSSFYTFINDYGDTKFGIKCDVCLSTEQQKLLLQSCTDSNVTQVVWSSALYDGGEFSHLSTEQGCFEIVGPTENSVTINSYLNFDPQSGCDPCIECNGIAYDYYTCEDPPAFGTFFSYQSLPSTFFYNPYRDLCCEIVSTGSAYYATETLYSVNTYNDCLSCSTASAYTSIWKASACTNSNTYSSFYVTTDNTVSSGDIVKLMWGSNEWICAELTSSSYSGYYTYYNTQTDGLGNTVTYDSCASCNSQGLIGVTLVPCELSNTEKFVSITLDNYLSIYNFGSLSNYTVKGDDGYCYRVTNICPIPLTEDGFTPVEFYFNCNFCTDTPHRDANPESTVCVICCPCGATGSTVTQVSPPHPVWTDGRGVPVTQLNMITIGGNGLNS